MRRTRFTILPLLPQRMLKLIPRMSTIVQSRYGHRQIQAPLPPQPPQAKLLTRIMIMATTTNYRLRRRNQRMDLVAISVSLTMHLTRITIMAQTSQVHHH